MKKLLVAASAVIAIFVLSLTCFAASADFMVSGGVLTSYTGDDAAVVIPDDVTKIASDAFSDCDGITSITIKSRTCQVESGAFPDGVEIKAYKNSPAHSEAVASGNEFTEITPKEITLTINYISIDGSVLAEPYVATLVEGDSYNVPHPTIENYTTNVAPISGTAGSEDITVTVIYMSDVPDGWHIVDTKVKYSQANAYITSTTKVIDGVSYTFDADGNLVAENGFFKLGGNIYYLENNTVSTGYKIIDGSIYYFTDSGVMLSNRMYDRKLFDADGKVVGHYTYVNVGASTYWLIDNKVTEGFVLYGNNIWFFDSDYTKVKNKTVNGYTFDRNGNLTSGIKVSSLVITPPSDLPYTGYAHTPDLEVYFGDILLAKDVHYTLSYENNTEVGTATVTLTGIGSVSGSVSFDFEIIGEKSYSITINYVDENGTELAASYKADLLDGSTYSVSSPKIKGYTADIEKVVGTINKKDVEVTVKYTSDTVESTTETETQPVTESESETKTEPKPTSGEESGKEPDKTKDTEKTTSEKTDKESSRKPEKTTKENDDDPEEVESTTEYYPEESWWNDPEEIETESESETETVETSESETTKDPVITTPDTDDDNRPSLNEVIETIVTYDFGLLIGVGIIATVTAGALIVIVIKWEAVVSLFSKIFKKIKDKFSKKQ